MWQFRYFFPGNYFVIINSSYLQIIVWLEELWIRFTKYNCFLRIKIRFLRNIISFLRNIYLFFTNYYFVITKLFSGKKYRKCHRRGSVHLHSSIGCSKNIKKWVCWRKYIKAVTKYWEVKRKPFRPKGGETFFCYMVV